MSEVEMVRFASEESAEGKAVSQGALADARGAEEQDRVDWIGEIVVH